MVIRVISSICLVLVIICELGDYPSFYSLGWLAHSFWEIFNPFCELPLLSIVFPTLIITWLISLCIKRERLWTTAMVMGVIFSIGLVVWVLPSPGALVVYGIRDHVMKVCTLDDLRHFARDIHREAPDIEVDHGDTSSLYGDQAIAYQGLQRNYPFLNWGIGRRDGPSISERDGAVAVEWGGALPGHWGFSVSVDGGKNDPDPDPDMRILRMSDDIYFYHGD